MTRGLTSKRRISVCDVAEQLASSSLVSPLREPDDSYDTSGEEDVDEDTDPYPPNAFESAEGDMGEINDLDQIKELFEAGEPVPQHMEDGDCVLVVAAQYERIDIIELMFTLPDLVIDERGLKDTTALMEAASNGNEEIVKLLLDHGADVHAQTNQGNTAIILASSGLLDRHLAIVKMLLKAGATVSECNENGHTPLMEAASAGNVAISRLLVSAGAAINTHSNEFKESALTLACYKGHLEMVKFLLEAGADREHKTEEMHTALMEASMDGHVEVAQLLLDSGAQVNMPADSFESPLTLAACGGHVGLTILLLERGANIEEVNDEGYTPLMEAAREGHFTVVSLLIDHGANINAQTEETQETALTLACCGGFVKVACLLIDQGADIEAGANSPLAEAAQEGHLDMVEKLLQAGAKVDAKSVSGDTPLMYAAENGHQYVVELLLDHGAQIEHEADGGRTALMKACRLGHVDTVALLIQRGANVNRASHNNDHTPLSLACAQGHMKVVDLLLSHGADVQYRLKDNSTMLMEACKNGHLHIVHALIEYNTQNRLSPVPIGSCGHSTCSILSPSADSTCLHMVTNLPCDSNHHLGLGPTSRFNPHVPECSGNQFAATTRSSRRMMHPASSSGSTMVTTGGKKGAIFKSSKGVSLSMSEVEGKNKQDDAKTLRETERLEQCINNMMKRTEMLNPSKEEQILQKQQILDELHRVERELQERSNMSVAASGITVSAEYSHSQMMDFDALWTVDGMNDLNPFDYGKGASDRVPLSSTKCRQKKQTRNNTRFNPKHVPSDEKVNLSEGARQLNISPDLYAGILQQDFPNFDTMDPSSRILLDQTITSIMEDPSLIGADPSRWNLTDEPDPQRTDSLKEEQLIQKQQIIDELHRVERELQERSNMEASFLNQVDDNFQSHSSSSPSDHPESSSSSPSSTPGEGEPGILYDHKEVGDHHPLNLASVASQTQSDGKTFDGDAKKLSSSYPQNTVNSNGPMCSSSSSISSHVNTNSSSVPSPPLFASSLEIDGQTESNHDTALTLSCSGGHQDLVNLLLTRGANCEHRDKKGFTPLMLAATAGHRTVCDTLLTHGVDIEAQSERTKDTALSLACSSGRYEVVELLLDRGANKEHRNVSDYTPLSLAASGGFVNIIKLLLSHGAEINSRTGSKLGISPLMLASMNGHAPTVKLLLDMGSDINAQIETNRNTALTLACFQGRCDVVQLLLERKANVEHRAKTGLTPLMEAASGGYVEVGRILLDRGADVNASPVPSSRDTALTIAADKGHYRFVELLIQRGDSSLNLDARNKKGSTPLWLAANGGHLDVVQLLVNSQADIDAQDNRKVSCLMAAFRKGHLKVVKWMVKHVNQFPADTEMTRYLSMINDKDLIKKCNQCLEVIRIAKDKQAAEANKNASLLLEELEREQQSDMKKKEAASKKREKKKAKKKEKAEKKPPSKGDGDKKSSGKGGKFQELPVRDSDTENESSDDEKEDSRVNVPHPPPPPAVPPPVVVQPPPPPPLPTPVKQAIRQPEKVNEINRGNNKAGKKEAPATREPVRKEPVIKEEKGKGRPQRPVAKNAQASTAPAPPVPTPSVVETKKQPPQRQQKVTPELRAVAAPVAKKLEKSPEPVSSVNGHSQTNPITSSYSRQKGHNRQVAPQSTAQATEKLAGKSSPSSKLDHSHPQHSEEKPHHHRFPTPPASLPITGRMTDMSISGSTAALSTSSTASSDDCDWKEVVPKSKRVSVPSNAISRVIGRAGCNINTVRELSGAHIEVEKQKGQQADRLIVIRGSGDATRYASQMINMLANEPEKSLEEIITELGLQKPTEGIDEADDEFSTPVHRAKSGSVSTPNSKGASKSSASTATASSSSKQKTAIGTWTGPGSVSNTTTPVVIDSKLGSPTKQRSTSPDSNKSSSKIGNSNDYTPFSNSFPKVGANVWGSKQDQKLNFATVAARGSNFTPNSGGSGSPPPTTPLTVQAEPIMVEPSKAPGFRGNYVSPSSLSPSVSSSMGQPAATTSSYHSSNRTISPIIPPISEAPSSSPPVVLPNQEPISMPSAPLTPVMRNNHMDVNSFKGSFNLAPGSRAIGSMMSHPPQPQPSSHMEQRSISPIQPPIIDTFNPHQLPGNLNPNAQTYAPELLGGGGGRSGSMNVPSMIGQSRNVSFGAPSRSQNASMINNLDQGHIGQGRMTSSAGPSQSRSMNENIHQTAPQLHFQMKAALLAAGASLQMAVQDSQRQQQHMHGGGHLAQHTVGPSPLQTNSSFSIPSAEMPPSAETLKLLTQALNTTKAQGGVHSSSFMNAPPVLPPVQMSNVPFMQQSSMNRRNEPDPRISSMGDFEPKPIARPIGSERAQKKNPLIPPTGHYGNSHSFGQMSHTGMDMWSSGHNDMESELLGNIPAHNDTLNLLNSYSNRGFESMDHSVDPFSNQSFNPSSSNNLGSYMNGVDSIGNMSTSHQQHQHQQHHINQNPMYMPGASGQSSHGTDFWTSAKMPSHNTFGNGMDPAMDPKNMTWHNPNPNASNSMAHHWNAPQQQHHHQHHPH